MVWIWFDHPPPSNDSVHVLRGATFIVLQFIFDAFDAHELGFENCGLKVSLGGLRMVC